MNYLTSKPYLIFWLSIPLLVLYGIVNMSEMLNINIHDTYFVLGLNDLAYLISLVFGIIGLGYWIMYKSDKKLSKKLNFIHISLTFGGILLIWILAQNFRESILDYNFNDNLTLSIYLIALITAIGQLVYPINLIIGLTQEGNKTSG